MGHTAIAGGVYQVLGASPKMGTMGPGGKLMFSSKPPVSINTVPGNAGNYQNENEALDRMGQTPPRKRQIT